MEYYAGIDVSLKESSVCVVDATRKVVREVKIASEPEALVGYFEMLGLPVTRIGLEAGPHSKMITEQDQTLASRAKSVRTGSLSSGKTITAKRQQDSSGLAHSFRC